MGFRTNYKGSLLLIILIVSLSQLYNSFNSDFTFPINSKVNSYTEATSNNYQELLKTTSQINLTKIGYWNNNFGMPIDNYVVGDLAYVLSYQTGLVIINVSDQSNPTLLSTFRMNYCGYHSIKVHKDYVYIGTFSGLLVINVTNPSNPIEIYHNRLFGLNYFDFKDDYLYGLDHYSLKIYDIVNPADPTYLNAIQFSDFIKELRVYGEYLYLVEDNGGIYIYSLSSPSNPTFISQETTVDEYGYRIYVQNNLTYTTNLEDGLLIFNTTNKADPELVGSYSEPFPTLAIIDIVVINDYAFCAGSYSGLTVLDISDVTNPIKVALYNNFGRINRVKELNGVLLANMETGKTIIFDISDPSNLTIIGFFNHGGFCHNILVDGDIAYLANGYNGLEIINVTNPANPILLANYPTTNEVLSVDKQNDLLFISIYFTGVHVLNISDPNSPEKIGEYQSINEYSQYNEIIVLDELALLASGYGGFEILNITDPENIELLDSFRRTDFNVYHIKPYRNYVIILDLLEEFSIDYKPYVLDISNPKNIKHVSTLTFTDLYATDIEIQDDYAFISNYIGGFFVIDILDITQPMFITKYETENGITLDILLDGNIIYLSNFLYSEGRIEIINCTTLEKIELIGTYHIYPSYRLFLKQEFIFAIMGFNGLEICNKLPSKYVTYRTISSSVKLYFIMIAIVITFSVSSIINKYLKKKKFLEKRK